MEVVLHDLHYRRLLHKLSYCERINYSVDAGNEACHDNSFHLKRWYLFGSMLTSTER